MLMLSYRFVRCYCYWPTGTIRPDAFAYIDVWVFGGWWPNVIYV